MTNKPEVIIMRGPSGAGKSTFIMDKLVPVSRIVSADHFFERRDDNGDEVYNFNPAKLAQAHADCMANYLHALSLPASYPKIVVDNTNIHLWEIENYIRAAELSQHAVHIIEICPTSIEGLRLCVRRNRHRVPAEVIARMCLEFEPYTGQLHVVRINNL